MPNAGRAEAGHDEARGPLGVGHFLFSEPRRQTVERRLAVPVFSLAPPSRRPLASYRIPPRHLIRISRARRRRETRPRCSRRNPSERRRRGRKTDQRTARATNEVERPHAVMGIVRPTVSVDGQAAYHHRLEEVEVAKSERMENEVCLLFHHLTHRSCCRLRCSRHPPPPTRYQGVEIVVIPTQDCHYPPPCLPSPPLSFLE